jgi:glyoxylase-like metal-dependent hydrolase (beta-lactamase superfamily II)
MTRTLRTTVLYAALLVGVAALAVLASQRGFPPWVEPQGELPQDARDGSSAQASPYFRFHEVGPGLYASLTRDELSPSSYANAVVVVGEESALVVDAHHDRESGAYLSRQIQMRTGLPVRWLVLTHWHGDHVWGSSALIAAFPALEVLSHPATRDSMAEGGSRQITQEKTRLEGLVARLDSALQTGELPAEDVPRYREAAERYRRQRSALDEVEVVVPRETVEGRRRIDLGGREVVVLHPGPAHTRGDLVVWVPDARFLIAGDLLEDAPLWVQGADVRGWNAALTRIEELDPARVLPAHGRLRSDAALLHAHAAFLRAATALMDDPNQPDSSALVEALLPQWDALRPWVGDAAAFAAYVESVRREALR